MTVLSSKMRSITRWQFFANVLTLPLHAASEDTTIRRKEITPPEAKMLRGPVPVVRWEKLFVISYEVLDDVKNWRHAAIPTCE